MFTPIKNFITYIQNAGGSGMFGTPTATTTITTTTTEMPTPTLVIGKSINTLCKETPILTTTAKKIKLTEIDNKMEKEKETLIKKKISIPEDYIIEVTLEEDTNNMPLNKTTTTLTAATTTNNVNNNIESNKDFVLCMAVDNNNDDDDDDIELQIKSSIMVKPSVLSGDKVEKQATPSHSNNGLRHTRTIMRRASISGPGPMASEEPMKFIPPPGLGKIVDRDKLNKKLPNISSTAIVPMPMGAAVEEVKVMEAAASPAIDDVLNESFESALEDDSFLEVSLPEIPNSEIIVLNCLETSSPTTTATPTEDPLILESSFNSLDNQNEVKSLNGSLNSTDEINVEMMETSVVHGTDNDAAAGAVYWLNVEGGGVDGCDNNNLSVEDAICTRQENNIEVRNENNKSVRILTTRHEHLEEGRSEGSDSGLGVEAAQITKFKEVQAPGPPLTQLEFQVCSATATTTITAAAAKTPMPTISTSSTLPYDATTATQLSRRPLRSNLKRRLEVSGGTQTTNGTDAQHDSVEKRPKRSINFDTVKVYYFTRQQGFSCVPSAGGCTLGMSAQHHGFKTMTLAEHAAELRRAHRMQLQEINPRASSSEDSEESEEDFLSEGSGSDLDGETNGFLQPVTPKQRRALLKAAGVRKIDASEKLECRDIRNSREVCGCTCRDFCDPETCACSQAGIKCQVDRAMFPCGCSRDACGNTVGRVEFNPARVRTHFIHTIMRLEMENRQQQQPHVNNNNNNNNNTNMNNINNNNNTNNNISLNNCAHMSSPVQYYNAQNQSNYSSGYASPAYTSEHAIGGGSQSPANYYAHQPQEQHYMGGSAEMHHQANSYQMDSLDAGLYTTHNAMHVTPTYGELTSTVATTPYGNNAHYNTTTNYAEPMTSRSNSPYGSCYMSQSNHNYTSERNPAPQQQQHNYIANGNSSPICTFVCASENSGNGYRNDDVIGDGGASFIDLSSPVANATRLSQINDMLQQNRHTTATLVAVTQTCTTTEISSAFRESTLADTVVTGMQAIAASPPPSPTSSTTISVENDDTSNISVINNAEECMNPAQCMNMVMNGSSPTSTRLQTNFTNSKEISIDVLNSQEFAFSSTIIAVAKEQDLQ